MNDINKLKVGDKILVYLQQSGAYNDAIYGLGDDGVMYTYKKRNINTFHNQREWYTGWLVYEPQV